MNFLFVVDAFLMDRIFEPFAHWFQKLTGKTNFWLCRQALLLSLIFYLIIFVYYGKEDIIGVLLLFLIFFAIPCKLTYDAQYKEEKRFLNNDYLKGCKNPARKTEWKWRIFRIVTGLFLICVLALFADDIIRMKDYICSLFVVAHFTLMVFNYFSACTPLPPGTSKIKEWFNKIFLSLAPAYKTNK